MQKFETTYELFNSDDEIKRKIINSIIDNYNRTEAYGKNYLKKLEMLDILCGCLQGLDKNLDEFLEHCRKVFNFK